jgi:hypothetical protein
MTATLTPASLRRVLELYGRLVARHVRTGLQMSPPQYAMLAAELCARSPCAALVFGCGEDSPLWALLNEGGRNVFVEDVPRWADAARGGGLEVVDVRYESRLNEWMSGGARPPAGMGDELMSVHWDVVLVDAPLGVGTDAHGREQSIFAASLLRERHGSAVYVHDYNRSWERACCDRYLGPPGRVLDNLGIWPDARPT